MNKPSKAYANSSFLNSPDARPIRVQCELIEPSVRFAEQKVENTIVLFSSARSKDSTQAKKDLEALLEKLPEDPTQRTDEQTREVLKKERILMLSKVLRPSGRALPAVDGVVSCRRGSAKATSDLFRRRAWDDGSCKQRPIKPAVHRLPWGSGLPLSKASTNMRHRNSPSNSTTFSFENSISSILRRRSWSFRGSFSTMDELFETLTLAQTGKLDKNYPCFFTARNFGTA